MGGKPRQSALESHRIAGVAREFAASLVAELLSVSGELSAPIVKIVLYREQTAITPVDAWVFTDSSGGYARGTSAVEVECGHSSRTIPATVDDSDLLLAPLEALHPEATDALDWGNSIGLSLGAYYNELQRELSMALDTARSNGLAVASDASIDLVDDDGDEIFSARIESSPSDWDLSRAVARIPAEALMDVAAFLYESHERQEWLLQSQG